MKKKNKAILCEESKGCKTNASLMLIEVGTARFTNKPLHLCTIHFKEGAKRFFDLYEKEDIQKEVQVIHKRIDSVFEEMGYDKTKI